MREGIGLLLGLCAAGCDAPAAEDSGAGGEDSAEESTMEHDLSLEELDDALRSALAAGLPDPLLVNDWLWTLAEEEGARAEPCFVITEAGTDRSVSWQGTCDREGGDSFSGVLLLSVRDETTEEGDRRIELSYLGSLDGLGASGSWEMGGTGSAMLMETPVGVAFSAEVGGTFDLGEGWTDGAADASLSVASVPVEGGAILTLDGGLTTPDQVSLYLWDLQVDPARCAAAPTGRVGVRDTSTGWFDLSFGDDCSGCAAVSWQGQLLGESCTGDLFLAEIEAMQARFAAAVAG